LWKAIFQLRGASEQTSLNMKSLLRDETVLEYGRWYLLSVGNALGLQDSPPPISDCNRTKMFQEDGGARSGSATPRAFHPGLRLLPRLEIF
jgi:hypothetical protein